MFDNVYNAERLRGFSDGMFSVIITIMVLDLKAPHTAEPQALLEQGPELFAYALSYMQAGIYWVNHVALFKEAEKVDDRILWLNMLQLFTLSLIPFATAYIGANNAAPFPTTVYAVVMLLPALVFTTLHGAILKLNPADDKVTRSASAKGYIALGLYVTAVPAAYFASPALALALIFTVAVMYFVPTRFF